MAGCAAPQSRDHDATRGGASRIGACCAVLQCCQEAVVLWRTPSSCHAHSPKQGLLCSGAVQRPWCPEARLAEHIEAQALKEEAERKQAAAKSAVLGASAPQRPARTDFPPLQVACCYLNEQIRPSRLS